MYLETYKIFYTTKLGTETIIERKATSASNAVKRICNNCHPVVNEKQFSDSVWFFKGCVGGSTQEVLIRVEYKY